MQFPTGKCTFLKKNAFSCRKMHFPAEKCGFRGAHGRKPAGNCRRASFGTLRARQGVSYFFGGTVFVCPVLRGIRLSQIPGSSNPRPSKYPSIAESCRVAQEPNRNRKPEPSEPFSQEPNAEPEPPEPFSRNRNQNRPLCETVLKHTKKTLLKRNRRNRKPEPLEPFHPQTVTEPNRTGATLILRNRFQFLRCERLEPHLGGLESLSSLQLREAKPGGFQTGWFLTFFGKGPDCVADPFGTVPRRCS